MNKVTRVDQGSSGLWNTEGAYVPMSYQGRHTKTGTSERQKKEKEESRNHKNRDKQEVDVG